MILKIIKFVLTDMVAQLQCDYSNQGHPTKLSTNLTNKMNCGDHPKYSFQEQVVHVIKLYITKTTDLWSFWIICWKTIRNLHDFHSLNLY